MTELRSEAMMDSKSIPFFLCKGCLPARRDDTKGKRKIKDNQGLFAVGLKKYTEGTIIHKLFILVKTRDHSCLFRELD